MKSIKSLVLAADGKKPAQLFVSLYRSGTETDGKKPAPLFVSLHGRTEKRLVSIRTSITRCPSATATHVMNITCTQQCAEATMTPIL